MSVYYDFYLGKMNEESKKMDIIGPKIEGRLRSFYNRSQSFIDGEEVEDNMALRGPESFSDEFWAELGYKKENDYRPNVYVLNMKLVSDYVTRHAIWRFMIICRGL